MKIYFLVNTPDRKTHILQHDTSKMYRPVGVSSSKVNVEMEWERYQESPPGKAVVKGLMDKALRAIGGADEHPYETPSLTGAMEITGSIESMGRPVIMWYRGVEQENYTNLWWEEVLPTWTKEWNKLMEAEASNGIEETIKVEEEAAGKEEV